MQITRNIPLWALWLFLCLGCWIIRPPLPVDETRYLSVAWEMWQKKQFLVPYLNGHPYSHKPPLLFWLINLGWSVFGVNGWWPRMVPALFALGSLHLTRHLAGLLWPAKPAVAELSPYVVLGGFLWAVFDTLLMFDVLIVFFTLVALRGLWSLMQGKEWAGALLMALAMGGGILAKGPVIFAHVLPVALVGPLWWPGKLSLFRWLGKCAWVIGAVAGAAAIGLSWAIPAARAGGEAYADAILWQQTAGRVVDSFAHGQPWWWYLPVLPLLVLPWLLSPAFWRGLLRFNPSGTGFRLSISWLAAVLAVFSLVSGKQVYYLLPLTVPLAMLTAAMMAEVPARRYDSLPFALLVAVIGLVWLLVPALAEIYSLPPWVENRSLAIGFGFLLVALATVALPVTGRKQDILKFAAASISVIVLINGGFFLAAGKSYEVGETAKQIRRFQDEGIPVAFVGHRYDGDYHFAGRLRKPLEHVYDIDMEKWMAAHPGGRVINHSSTPPDDSAWVIDSIKPYRGRYTIILKPPSAKAGP